MKDQSCGPIRPDCCCNDPAGCLIWDFLPTPASSHTQHQYQVRSQFSGLCFPQSFRWLRPEKFMQAPKLLSRPLLQRFMPSGAQEWKQKSKTIALVSDWMWGILAPLLTHLPTWRAWGSCLMGPDPRSYSRSYWTLLATKPQAWAEPFQPGDKLGSLHTGLC